MIQHSRKNGYKWLNRYLDEGPGGLHDRSRAPQVTTLFACVSPRVKIVLFITMTRVENPVVATIVDIVAHSQIVYGRPENVNENC